VQVNPDTHVNKKKYMTYSTMEEYFYYWSLVNESDFIDAFFSCKMYNLLCHWNKNLIISSFFVFNLLI
jgi:hypothetical protein